MTPPATALLRGRFLGWGIAIAVALTFVGANVHLVAVALSSDPACVPHLDHPSEGAGFRAAKSSC